jgi:selenocysteine-specific elongation factor
LRALVAPGWRPAAFRDWLERLAARGRLSLGADAVALATHAPGLDAEQGRLYASLLRALDEIGLLAAPEEDWLRRAGAWPAGKALTAFALRSGDAVRLNDGTFLSGKAWRELLDRLRQEGAAGRTAFEVPAFKDWFGLTRKHAIPILEKLDDLGVTQRVGNQRRIRTSWKDGRIGE